jgi:GntR family carbon starvation induced transcriptional regulator
MPTQIPSVATFTGPGVQPPIDVTRSPTQAAAFWLGRDIVRGVFVPGERLKVELLTRFYKVGHSPVREAILLLSTSGLIVHELQKGYRVAPVSLADYDDLIGSYQRIYKLALALAMQKGAEAWEERVVLALHRSQKVKKVLEVGSEDRELWQRTYKMFHRELLSGCDSPIMLKIAADLGNRVERYGNLFGDFESDRSRDHYRDHRTIADAIVERDAAKLSQLVEKYFATAQPIRDSIIARLKVIKQGASDE